MREIRILGAVEVFDDGRPVAVGGPRQQATLVVLALHPDVRVSVEQLIDGIWGERSPSSAVKTVRAYVSRLGAALGDGVVVADHGGYRLRTMDVRVDARQFLGLVSAARGALADDAPLVAGRALDEALGLWRGESVGEGAQLEGLSSEAQELAESRLVAEELRLDAWLMLGRNDLAIQAAERLVEREPLREGLWERLMLALGGAGRRADALAAFARARCVLVEQLGLEPGEALSDLQARILRGELPAATVAAQIGNLPAPVTSFVGREAELASLAELIGQSRLVTLVGVGGAGKTRLAIEAALRWRAERGALAWFVDLAPLRDPALVVSQVMVAIGAQEATGTDPLEVCATRLRGRRTLLLLDNCEHLVGACAGLGLGLLEACPRLLVLATSRSPLAVAGETVYTVPPLATPDEHPPRWRTELSTGYDAVRLFLERARAARADGLPADVDLALVGELCRRLDGLPLAIEFAAARMRSMSLNEIAAGMSNRFGLLAPTRRVGPERHRTLRAAIDWSHDLLEPEDQVLLRQLSIFDGGFTTESAHAVCTGRSAAAVSDGLERLLDASLILVDPAGERTRYRLYETVREYAAERLTDADEHARVQAQHARYYCDLAELAASELFGAREQAWLQRLDAEHDNLRAALRWATTPTGNRALLARIAIALGPFWRLRGTLDEGAAWLQAALTTVAAQSVQQAGLRIWLGAIRVRQAKLDEAVELLESGIATARAEPDAPLVATGLYWLANTRLRQGQSAAGIPLLEEAVVIWEQRGETIQAAWPIGLLADIAHYEGRYAEAQALFERGLPIFRAHGWSRGILAYLQSMAELACATGELDRSEILCHEALPIAEQIGDLWHIGLIHNVLGRLSRARGHLHEAAEHALAGLERHESLRTINELAEAIELLGGIALDTGHCQHGALLLAGSRKLREANAVPSPHAALRATADADWNSLTEICGAEIGTIRQQAATLSLDELIGFAKQLRVWAEGAETGEKARVGH
ncbi:MAG: tetratricopeptide repeat protein [Solirubrobacterales bacterium]|nr:tetratricopeptide repeat protein [Solirubrobacterales bacterium]